MRLYLECAMGASGDMLMAALYELLPDKEAFRERIKRIGLDSVTFKYSETTRCGITGTRIAVRVGGVEEISDDVMTDEHEDSHSSSASQSQNLGQSQDQSQSQSQSLNQSHDHGHDHDQKRNIGADMDQRWRNRQNRPVVYARRSRQNAAEKRYTYSEIQELILNLDLPDNVTDNALGVYKILGEAEAAVHGVTFESVHLHEVGALDAVADIVGCCLLVNMLGVTEIIASPVNVGSGCVQCEHGILPVPAPATVEILKGVPIYSGDISGELCTPTGAALLKHFAGKFCEMPSVTVIKVGYGMGKKEFDAANCLRAFLCEDESRGGGGRDVVYEISCNLDDMTPEAVGAAFEVLLDNGALDVYTTPIMMKKGRSAVMLSCLCTENDLDTLKQLLLENTSTLGVRVATFRRDILSRSVGVVSTKYGDIRVKYARGFGATKHKPEYDDVLAAANQNNVSFTTVYNAALHAAGD